MDPLSHGLWAFILYFNHPKKYWAILLGILPDIVTWVIHQIDHLNGTRQIVYDLVYQFTHSFVILLIVCGVIYLFWKKIPWLAGAWGLHTVLDMFSHTYA